MDKINTKKRKIDEEFLKKINKENESKTNKLLEKINKLEEKIKQLEKENEKLEFQKERYYHMGPKHMQECMNYPWEPDMCIDEEYWFDYNTCKTPHCGGYVDWSNNKFYCDNECKKEAEEWKKNRGKGYY